MLRQVYNSTHYLSIIFDRKSTGTGPTIFSVFFLFHYNLNSNQNEKLLPCRNHHGHLILNFSLQVCTSYHLVTMATPDS